MQNRFRLLRLRDDRAAAHLVPNLYGHMNRPFFLFIQRGHAHTTSNVDTGRFRNTVQRALDTIENIMKDTGAKRNRDRIASRRNRLTGMQTTSLLEDLNRCALLIQTDNLAHQLLIADIYHLGHLEAGVALQVDNRTVHTVDNTRLTHV